MIIIINYTKRNKYLVELSRKKQIHCGENER